MKSKRERILEILNRDLTPWTFEGDEPIAVELIAVAEELPLDANGEPPLFSHATPDEIGRFFRIMDRIREGLPITKEWIDEQRRLYPLEFKGEEKA